MFYLPRKSKMGDIWNAATMHSKLSPEKLDKINLNRICEYIMNPPAHMSLRLSSTLMAGVAMVHEQKVNLLCDDVNRLLVEIESNKTRKVKPNTDSTVISTDVEGIEHATPFQQQTGDCFIMSDLPSGGSSTGKRKLSGALEGVVEYSEDEMISGENGINEGRRKYSRQEKGKDKLLLNDNDKMELHLGSELLSSVHNVVPSPSQIVENVALQDEIRATNTNARQDGRERFRVIARRNASRFARFDPQEEVKNDMPPKVDVEDSPGPFSTALKIIRDGAEKNVQVQSAYKDKTKPASLDWVPKCQDRALSKNLIPSLQELCLSVLAKNADAIVSLESVPDALRHQLSHLLCDSRRMNTHFFELLVQGSPTEVRLRDCSWLTEEEFTIKIFSAVRH